MATKPELKTLGEIVTPGGPCFLKTQMALQVWFDTYSKRGAKGDDAVCEFLTHLGELSFKSS